MSARRFAHTTARLITMKTPMITGRSSRVVPA